MVSKVKNFVGNYRYTGRVWGERCFPCPTPNPLRVLKASPTLAH